MTFTDTGRAIRAVAKEKLGAQLAGIDVAHIYAVTFGLGTACVAIAACLLIPSYYVNPSVGDAFVLVAFTIVVLGGMGFDSTGAARPFVVRGDVASPLPECPQLKMIRMRILGAEFVRRFDGRLVNIHPSLLPAFPGLHTHRRAIEAGCKASGATVHFVTADLDHGPIIGQAVVPVLADDGEEALAARVLAQEHVLYPRAIRWLVEGSLERRGGAVVQTRGEAQLLLSR